MTYNKRQIAAAYENARLHGLECPDDETASQFLDWYHSAKTEYSSIEEAERIGLSGLSTNGIRQQEDFWQENL